MSKVHEPWFRIELREFSNGTVDELSRRAADYLHDHLTELAHDLKIAERELEIAQAENDRLAAAFGRTECDARILDWLEDEANVPGGLLLHCELNTGRRGLGLLFGTLRESVQKRLDARNGRH